MKLVKLLYPGMEIKRWMLLFLCGLVILSLGLAYLFVEFYRTVELPEIAATLTLQFIPRPIRGALFIGLGVSAAFYGLWRLNRSMLDAFRPDSKENLLDVIYNYRSRQRGPKVVAIGGGTGLPTVLRGLKQYTSNITAIVTVGDDGGSSGRLRKDFGVLPPGDFRNCLVALAEAEPLMGRLLQYRFGQGTGLDGHSFGNLFIVAMTGITGDFEEALRESSRVLAVRGRVLPSTLDNVVLWAELEDGTVIEGESRIRSTQRRIKQVHLKPEEACAYPEAVKAILEADLIVVGPGSLYTSVLPNLLVSGITRALLISSALKVYVCNVATERGETDDFTVEDHIRALLRHLPADPFDLVIANDKLDVAIPPDWKVVPVSANGDLSADEVGDRLVLADVVDASNPLRHDPDKLARALLRLYYDHGERREARRAAAAY